MLQSIEHWQKFIETSLDKSRLVYIFVTCWCTDKESLDELVCQFMFVSYLGFKCIKDMKYDIYPKDWDTFTIYHTSLKICLLLVDMPKILLDEWQIM